VVPSGFVKFDIPVPLPFGHLFVSSMPASHRRQAFHWLLGGGTNQDAGRLASTTAGHHNSIQQNVVRNSFP
jgi:hypothetical protein